MKSNLEKAGAAAGIALVFAATLASGPASAVNLIGLNDKNQLLTFDSNSPGISSSVAISKLALGETIVSIDFRNPNRPLSGLGSLGKTTTR